jgi:hypothetical protein
MRAILAISLQLLPISANASECDNDGVIDFDYFQFGLDIDGETAGGSSGYSVSLSSDR